MFFCRGCTLGMGYMEGKKMGFARGLRVEQTGGERLVWAALRGRRLLDLKFRRQHVIVGYVVAFYCHSLRLAIEIDGEVHDKQQDYDKLRQDLIENTGVTIIRVSNADIKKNINTLLSKIKNHINSPQTK